MIKVVWDEDLCISSRDCIGMLPKMFSMDEQDRILVNNESGATEEQIRHAVSMCPSGALRIEE